MLSYQRNKAQARDLLLMPCRLNNPNQPLRLTESLPDHQSATNFQLGPRAVPEQLGRGCDQDAS